MKLIIVKPELHKFASCAEFAEAFKLGENDLVLTNEYIFNPYFGKLNLPVHTIFQEKYGAGEPTDVMVDAIAADAVKTAASGSRDRRRHGHRHREGAGGFGRRPRRRAVRQRREPRKAP